jgi:hypothetical protein
MDNICLFDGINEKQLMNLLFPFYLFLILINFFSLNFKHDKVYKMEHLKNNI